MYFNVCVVNAQDQDHRVRLEAIAKVRRSPATRKIVSLETPPSPWNEQKLALQASTLRPMCIQNTIWSLNCDFFFETPHPPKRILFVSIGFCELLRWLLTNHKNSFSVVHYFCVHFFTLSLHLWFCCFFFFSQFGFFFICVQDPTNLDKFNLANFHHIKNNLKVDDEGTVLVLSGCEVYLVFFFFFVRSFQLSMGHVVDVLGVGWGGGWLCFLIEASL